MVTLLGFFFILGNVLLLLVFMPDLVGPVWMFSHTKVIETGVGWGNTKVEH